jgi:predicted phage terminase large subunit-like protein
MLNELEMLKNLPLMEAILYRKSFYDFVKNAWDVIETTEFISGWYVEAECNYAEAVYDGKIKNLIVNQPPRTLKSTIWSIMFPCWVWAKNPTAKFIFASYSQTLAVDNSKKCRTLILSDWYQERFPKVVLETASEDMLTTKGGGHRISIGVDGASTGRGADYIICDDILKASDAYSDTVRENTNKWYDETISTRRNDIKTGVRIIICQRLHENDIVGHILSKGETWEQLILPMEYDGIRFQSSIGYVDPRFVMGESLHPERFSKEDIEDLKISLGSYATPGQLQQRPTAIEGSIFKPVWFTNRINNTELKYRFLSFDTASVKTGAFSSCTVGELTNDYRLFIRYVDRRRVEFPDLMEWIKELIHHFNPIDCIYIENKSSGTQAIQSLQALDEKIGDLIIPVNIPANNDKIQRAMSAAIWCETGCVLLPPKDIEMYPWLLDFEDELFKFPATKYKDQTDSFTQLVNQLSDSLAEGLQFRKGGA